MSRTTKIAGLLCGTLLFFASAFASTDRPVRKPKPAAKPSAEVAQTQVQPVATAQPELPAPPPPTPGQLPAVPPKVTLSNGLLSINAENSNLGDVLSAVKSLTGAGLDVPPAANSERIVVHLGPATSQQVLQQLFAGSKFDYIILGANDTTGAVSKIILTPRSAGGAGGTAVAGARGPNGQPPMQRPGFQPPPEPEPDQDVGQVDDEIAQPEPPPPQNAEEVTPPAQGAQQNYIGPGGQAAANGDQQQQGPKTPEQLLQELQRMQQQQQQGQPGRPERPQVPPNSQ